MNRDTITALEDAALAVSIEYGRFCAHRDIGDEPGLTVERADQSMRDIAERHLALCQAAGFEGTFEWRSTLNADEPTHDMVMEEAMALRERIRVFLPSP